MINDLKDLKSLFKLCRAQGITNFKMNGIEIDFGDLPATSQEYSSIEEQVEINPYDGFPQEILSPEQLEFYAQGGLPKDDPYLKKASS